MDAANQVGFPVEETLFMWALYTNVDFLRNRESYMSYQVFIIEIKRVEWKRSKALFIKFSNASPQY